MAQKNYICGNCGQLVRYPQGSRPQHCGLTMTLLSSEQCMAAGLLPPERRVIWFRNGAKYTRGTGKRRWKPVG